MHDPTLTRLSSTLQRVGLVLGSTRVSNGRGRVAFVRFCTLPTHGEPAWVVTCPLGWLREWMRVRETTPVGSAYPDLSCMEPT